MKTLVLAVLATFLPLQAQPTQKSASAQDAAFQAALQRIYDRRHKEPVYAPPVAPRPVAPQSRRINPTMTAQKYMRTVYQPTDDELLFEEIRRCRSEAETERYMAEQRAFQERIIIEQRLAAIERARQLEAQRRSIESITHRPMLGR